MISDLDWSNKFFHRKLRFENSTNKKTLKRAWRFFLLYYLSVTSTGVTSFSIESSALKIVQTKKRSSELGVFSYCTIYP